MQASKCRDLLVSSVCLLGSFSVSFVTLKFGLCLTPISCQVLYFRCVWLFPVPNVSRLCLQGVFWLSFDSCFIKRDQSQEFNLSKGTDKYQANSESGKRTRSKHKELTRNNCWENHWEEMGNKTQRELHSKTGQTEWPLQTDTWHKQVLTLRTRKEPNAV